MVQKPISLHSIVFQSERVSSRFTQFLIERRTNQIASFINRDGGSRNNKLMSARSINHSISIFISISMDQETCAAFVAMSAGAMATLFAGFVLIHAVGNGQKDGRSWMRPKARRFALRINSFLKAYEMEEYHEGWFVETLRCTKHSFDSLVALIEEQWEAIHGYFPAHNAVFSVKERVGVCLHYLTHSGSRADSAKIFGMGRSGSMQNDTNMIPNPDGTSPEIKADICSELTRFLVSCVN